ncbi:hypothetical protein BKA67DRAFT_685744 [Truncatella angustata]|uniref:Uncharacterized protein n=1 Tax=Truncatella angustata TaxID=152316 RepID=A0A9P8UU35_9PEZI|nr:uncharacterized protein BKA67DRAFT_685744 [Truncatella angustata]KAH6659169.1 hypothetical protein BKA67DRAFT_685744 [Truncatella angustata]KAH8204877.1 hypothetical protein TruAng_000916 [Truncatella angustata]
MGKKGTKDIKDKEDKKDKRDKKKGVLKLSGGSSKDSPIAAPTSHELASQFDANTLYLTYGGSLEEIPSTESPRTQFRVGYIEVGGTVDQPYSDEPVPGFLYPCQMKKNDFTIKLRQDVAKAFTDAATGLPRRFDASFHWALVYVEDRLGTVDYVPTVLVRALTTYVITQDDDIIYEFMQGFLPYIKNIFEQGLFMPADFLLYVVQGKLPPEEEIKSYDAGSMTTVESVQALHWAIHVNENAGDLLKKGCEIMDIDSILEDTPPSKSKKKRSK